MAGNRSNFAGAEIHQPFEHFFKAISPETVQNKKMMLPEKFGLTFRGKLPTQAKLKVPNGKVWTVGLTRERNPNRVWLDSGFGDFLDYHSVMAQYLLMFKYDGRSSFNVVICDTTACEVVFPRAYPQASSDQEDSDMDDDSEFNADEPSEEEEEEEEEISDSNSDSEEGFVLGANDKSKQAEDGNRRGGSASGSRRRVTKPDAGNDRAAGNGASGSRQRSWKRPNAATGRDRVLWRRLEASKIATSTKFKNSIKDLSPGSKRAVERAICSKTRNPSALVVMMKFHIYPGFMYLPNKFAKTHFPRDREEVTLRACEDKRASGWELQVYGNRNDKNVFFFREWGRFRCVNDLVEGDACLLELIHEKKKKVVNVHIFRA
ncbi:unnamed protein product [Linum tenue]|uniref:TF-B3 domain-containing protein n=1 Tax=Linum tenue TaxID=586396 RepID=A0AAV0MN01_9ROSI|nr:unnamed protein product [Linum tenue]